MVHQLSNIRITIELITIVRALNLDLENHTVFPYFNALYWIEDYHIDGVRMQFLKHALDYDEGPWMIKDGGNCNLKAMASFKNSIVRLKTLSRCHDGWWNRLVKTPLHNRIGRGWSVLRLQ